MSDRGDFEEFSSPLVMSEDGCDPGFCHGLDSISSGLGLLCEEISEVERRLALRHHVEMASLKLSCQDLYKRIEQLTPFKSNIMEQLKTHRLSSVPTGDEPPSSKTNRRVSTGWAGTSSEELESEASDKLSDMPEVMLKDPPSILVRLSQRADSGLSDTSNFSMHSAHASRRVSFGNSQVVDDEKRMRVERHWRNLTRGIIELNKSVAKEGSEVIFIPLCIRDIWKRGKKNEMHKTDSDPGQQGALHSDNSASMLSGRHIGDVVRGTSCMQKFVIHPDSYVRMTWILLGAFLIFSDLVTVPISLSELATVDNLVFTLLSTIFWSMDIAMSFFLGYHRDGVIELRPSKTAKTYLRSWFGIDIVIVMCDWALSLASFHTADDHLVGLARLGKHTSRFFRTLRVARLVRVHKLFEWLYMTDFELFTSEQVVIFARLAMYVALIIIVNHYVGCFWFSVGNSAFQSGNPHNWLTVAGLDEADRKHQYLASLHWSLTQFSPATNNLVPANPSERLFASCVVIFALVIFSSFVSSITGAMAALASLNSQMHREESRLCEFLRERQISVELGQRVRSLFRKYARASRSRMKEEDLPVISRLPVSVKQKLRTQIFSRYLMKCHVINELALRDTLLLTHICYSVCSVVSYLSGEDIFMFGDKAKSALILTDGVTIYKSQQRMSAIRILSNQWVSEIALWADWLHKGRLVTQIVTEWVQLSMDKWEALFHEAKWEMTGVMPCLRRYARNLIAYASSDSNESGLELVDDLFGMDEGEHIFEIARDAFDSDPIVGESSSSVSKGPSVSGEAVAEMLKEHPSQSRRSGHRPYTSERSSEEATSVSYDDQVSFVMRQYV